METGEIGHSVSRPHNLMIDDDEPIYDRLGDKGGVVKMPRSPTPRHDSMNFRRVKGKNQTTRESVMNLADDLMERKIGSKGNYDPQPMEHMVWSFSRGWSSPLSSPGSPIWSFQRYWRGPSWACCHAVQC